MDTPLSARESLAPTRPARPSSAARMAALRRGVSRTLTGTDELPDEQPLRPRFGSVPRGLRGVLYRNGPGRFSVGDDSYRHLFDGDGLVTRFAFDRSGVRYRSRFVRTRAFVEENNAGRRLYRSYGTNLPGGPMRSMFRLNFKNVANTSVISHGGRLYALWEGGVPYRLHPTTLETLTRESFGGALRPTRFASRALGAEAPFSAHPKVDPRSGALFNFGMEPGLPSLLRIYEVGTDSAFREVRSLPLPSASFIHDFALTEHYFVFLVSSVHIDVPRMAAGLTSLLDAIESSHTGVRPLLIPRDGGAPVEAGELPPGFVYHLVQGFEAHGQVVVDALFLDDFAPRHFNLDEDSPLCRGLIPEARLHRVFIDPAGGRTLSRRVLDEGAELPTVSGGERARAAFMVVAADEHPGVYSAVGRVDLETGELRRADLWPLIAAEPVFCPNPYAKRDTEGWLLVVGPHAFEDRSVLAILDADSLTLLAQFDLPQLLPPGFHGTWVGSPSALAA